MANRLAAETSPYLLQHAHNPVDWYPWGSEALGRARAEDRPILLSIGYAACHWCHVMERESFENAETARLMNELFVNVKVDREERPDLDGIYMQAVQAMTGHGGWPMTVFLTPAGEPYYAGTYFPDEDRHGMPSFRRVLVAVADAYRNRRDDVARTTAEVQRIYEATREATRSTGTLTPELLDRVYRGLARQYDQRHGGFGTGAPKFPPTMSLEVVLQRWGRTGEPLALEMALETFRHMARGGIYDQVGGGFARYTVDGEWQIPHFEKMLYDNALLVRFGVHLWQATEDAEVRRVVEETIEWVRREMTAPEGGFYSSLDADSEGEEGKFYVWGAAEFDAALRERAGLDAGEIAVARAHWGVSDAGNFEGHTVLHVAAPPAVTAARGRVTEGDVARILTRARDALAAERERRVRPGRDDKVLAAWNGLMLRAIAEAARAFGRDDWRDVAVRCGAFLFSSLVRDGRALRSYKDGTAKVAGFLDDHAALGLGALALYEATFDDAWAERARAMADAMVARFWDDEIGAFFDTASDHEALIARPRDVTDNAVPSGTSLAVELLARLAELDHDVDARRRATYVVETLAEAMARYPSAFGALAAAADLLIHGAAELAIVGDVAADDFRALAAAASSVYVPSLVLAGGAPGSSPRALLAERPMVDGKATAYVCRNYTCDAPVTAEDALVRALAASHAR